MNEYLPFVSIDTWTIIFTWANLLILFLLLKKFLFKPITKILDKRAEEIENSYKQAEETNDKALSLKSEYEEKLLSAKNEADGIIKSAVETADRRSESIVNEANEKVRYIMEKSQKQIEQDKQNAVTDAKREIASMAVDAAEKIIGKKLTDSDDEELISDIIDRM